MSAPQSPLVLARPSSRSGGGAPAAIPEGLAAMPPGAELAQMLAAIDVERVSGFDTVEVLKAAYRQSCHDRARFLHALLEVGLREQFTGDSVVRLEVPDEFAPDEARAALAWSRRRADSAFDLAWNLHRRLPVLGEAMLAGELDEPRAVAFIRWTSGLTDAQAGWVCEHLISRAPTWTVGELIEHIQRLVLAIDPDWAEKRYREAVRRRRVVGMRNDDGTATVSGLDLPLDRAVAGCERIDDLARACKRAGDHRPVDHIRADLFLGSLDGSFEGLSDAEIVAHVRTHPFVDAAPSDAPADFSDIRPGDPATEPITEPVDNAADGRDDEPDHLADDEPDHAADDQADDKADDAIDGEIPDEPRSARRPETRNQTRPGPRSETGDPTDARPHGEAGGAARDEACGGTGQDHPQQHGHEPRQEPRHDRGHDYGQGLRQRLGPADGRPLAEQTSAQPSSAQTSAQARAAQAGQASAQTRSAQAGQASAQARAAQAAAQAGQASAQTRSAQSSARAGQASAQARSARAWSVPEIRVELTTLLGLDEHPAHLPGWGMVHAAQARQMVAFMLAGQWRYVVCADNGHLLLTGITGRRPCPPAQRPARDARRGGIVELQVTLSQLRELAAAPNITGIWAPLVADLARHAQLAETGQPDTGRPGTRSPDAAESAESAGRRHAGAALRRYVQIRGQVCSWPGCRMPATRTDQDHIHAWADDGATTADNLHLACRHDHRARHLGGWRVTAAGPHLIVWTSPLGHPYPSPLPKIIQPVPQPRPRNWPDAPPGRLPADLPGASEHDHGSTKPSSAPQRRT
ncbi:HNH endonuclease signature motif containing protein [Microbispora siamensis]|uniref:HNH endonuclease signature motif containing protein n=1 Tax=Microbispora siamensis TaxID=564413 RepID=UPI001952A080|nr:HNH endonuclease signature motif containing protein [Microbispora siamensis]